MTNTHFSHKLLKIMEPKPQTLTLKLDLDMLAEFAVAVKLFRGRSVSSHLHQFVIGQINEAKKLVPSAEFTRMVEDQKAITLDRSRSRAASARGGASLEETRVGMVPLKGEVSDVKKVA